MANPNKKVIIPDMDAGCSLADSAPEEKFKEWVNKYPDHIVISYINFIYCLWSNLNEIN